MWLHTASSSLMCCCFLRSAWCHQVLFRNSIENYVNRQQENLFFPLFITFSFLVLSCHFHINRNSSFFSQTAPILRQLCPKGSCLLRRWASIWRDSSWRIWPVMSRFLTGWRYDKRRYSGAQTSHKLCDRVAKSREDRQAVVCCVAFFFFFLN